MGKSVSTYLHSALLNTRQLAESEAEILENSEAWRYTGPFTRWNRFKGAFPGLGIATVAFTVYVVYEQIFLKDDHHSSGHGEEHH